MQTSWCRLDGEIRKIRTFNPISRTKLLCVSFSTWWQNPGNRPTPTSTSSTTVSKSSTPCGKPASSRVFGPPESEVRKISGGFYINFSCIFLFYICKSPSMNIETTWNMFVFSQWWPSFLVWRWFPFTLFDVSDMNIIMLFVLLNKINKK